jgi:microcystin-dependent protein
MTQPFMGEIRAVSFGFTPKGWAACNGQLLAITQNQALFSLLGTTYGGDGVQTFALPDLRARAAMHAGRGHAQGERAGEANHTLTVPEVPQHHHTLSVNTTIAASNNGNTPTPGVALGQSAGLSSSTGPFQVNIYSTQPTNTVALAPQNVAPTGGAPHENCQPYLGVTYLIALQGIFPSRN